MLSTPHDSTFILVFCVERSSRNSDEVTPCGAAKQRWGLKISHFSTNNSIYLRNGWRYMLRGFWQALNSLSIHVTFTAIIPGAYPRESKMWQKTLIRSRKLPKTSHSPPISRYISEMVEDRWVHAARRLTSVEFSFDQCDIYRDSPRGEPRGGQNVQKMC